MSVILEQFGAKVRKYRIKKKLSQEKLAEIADLHRTYIGQVESGKRNIALKNIEKLAKALNVDIRELFK
ncbi:MAG: helix-turn-helix transcriptional regulator [Candidatus Omnitrophica bacterium]|nr:helix-turn-helix transcriptional regulator [Candidatus Omnitrophota bacterium]MDD5592793.1 helix-turn-helix transcriptional regulator [Candidatus Omnitrophota bacterium]